MYGVGQVQVPGWIVLDLLSIVTGWREFQSLERRPHKAAAVELYQIRSQEILSATADMWGFM